MKRTEHMHIKLTNDEREAVKKVSNSLGISMSAAVGYSVTNIQRIIERNKK